jgi:hypothetical protein
MHYYRNIRFFIVFLSSHLDDDTQGAPSYCQFSGFGGAEVACWPLIPKFAGSNLAEAVGFLKGDKNPQHAFLQKGSKIIGPVSLICGMKKNPGCISQAPSGHHFSSIVPPLAARGLPRVVDARGTWRPEYERLEEQGIVQ